MGYDGPIKCVMAATERVGRLHVGPLHTQLQLLQMHSCRPFKYTAAAAADAFITGFVLVLCIRSCISCRCLCTSPLLMQLQKLPIRSCWPFAYAASAAADALIFRSLQMAHNHLRVPFVIFF